MAADVTKNSATKHVVGGDSDDDWQPPDLPSWSRSNKTKATDLTTCLDASNQLTLEEKVVNEPAKLPTAEVLQEEVVFIKVSIFIEYSCGLIGLS